MTCAACGTANPPNARFCLNCGTRLAEACPSCGAPRPEGARFCGQCGTGFASPAPASGPATTPAVGATPGPGAGATGAPVSGSGGSGAERRLVSVLFADLVSFTTLAEGRDAEETRELLSRYFEIASDVVTRYGGTVEKFIGDAVMAVWGTPVAHEDDAERAVRAGLDLVDAVRALGADVNARAGILTGEAAVTLGAANQGMVAGDMVNTAARLQGVAQPGTVLVGEATMHAAAAAVAFEPAGEQTLKGKAAPVPAWRALRVVAQRGGQGRSDLPEPPFVGRDDEFRLLKDLLGSTGRDRRARLLVISGPGGIGKSRLAWELEKYIDGISEDIYWHRGRSPSYGEGITFWALGEMVRRRAKLAEDDDEATTRQRIAETVAEYVTDEQDRRWVEPGLLTLLGLEPAPAGGRDVLFAAWRIFFERIAARGTTVLLFEDLQWADTGLLDFIEHIVEWSKGVPIVVVGLARPELFDRRPDWAAGARGLTSLSLDPLDDEAMGRLVAGFVPGLPEAAVTAIVRRADGMPLYAVETVRALLADGKLERTDDGYRPTGDLSELAVPDTLRSLIASRLDALEAGDRSLVADAAVLGQTFTKAALAAVSGRPESELDERLRGLVRRQFFDLEADPRSPERGQYGFVQSLIREVASATLARRERRARHLAAARYFEALGDDELAGLLASHYLAAHEASEAGPEAEAIAIQARLALSAAAERAETLGAHDQAVAHLRQAVTGTADERDRAELLVRAAAAADAGGTSDDAEALANGAIATFRGAGDTAGATRARARLGDILLNAGKVADARADLEATLAELPADGEDEVRAEVLTTLSRALYRDDAALRSAAVAEEALTLVEHLGLDHLLADALINRSAALSYLDRPVEAGAVLEEAIRVAQRTGQVGPELRARANMTSLTWDEDPPRAMANTFETLELCRRLGNRTMEIWTAWFAGWSRFFRGEWDLALETVAESIERATNSGDRVRLNTVVIAIGTARGEPIDGLLEELRRVVGELSDAALGAFVDYHDGELALVGGRPEDAYVAFDRAVRATTYGAATYLPYLTRAATWERDVEHLRDVSARLDADDSREALINTHRLVARSGIAALEGRPDEATAGYKRAIAAYTDHEMPLWAAWTAADAAVALGAGDAASAAFVGAARASFERMGARAYLTALDAALGVASASRPPVVADAGVAART